MRIVISSGHGKYVRGASGLIDEVDEARRVVSRVADFLRMLGHEATEFHDNTSTTQNENLNTIVNFHNSQKRDFDVSVHFNAYVPTDGGRGTEVLYLTQDAVATRVVNSIAEASGLINRGIKKRTDLFFLNKTEMPAILIEVCFVDAGEDVKKYQDNFDKICAGIAAVRESPPVNKVPKPTFYAAGKCSWFGGPKDKGVTPDEGLAFLYEYDDAPHLFLPKQPPGTTGLARRLNPKVYYVACRWDYDVTPKTMLADSTKKARVSADGKTFLAWPADWGPNENTGRVADLSSGLMEALGLETDQEVEVLYPVVVIDGET